MKELFKKHLAKHISLSSSEFDKFIEPFKLKIVKKKEFYLQQGEVCKYEAFVIKGLFKIYHLDNKGSENIINFAASDWWLGDIDSFNNETPSKLFIEALEDSEIFIINKYDKEVLYEELPKVEKLFRIMGQKAMVALQRRVIDSISKTADLRYVDFIEKNSSIAQRLTNLQIAAYLGISHEFLSKIKKKISAKK